MIDAARYDAPPRVSHVAICRHATAMPIREEIALCYERHGARRHATRRDAKGGGGDTMRESALMPLIARARRRALRQ